MESQDTKQDTLGLKRKIHLSNLSLVDKYHVQQTLLLSAVPVICGSLLLLLLFVFAKLNLFYFEANGLMLDEQVRGAYFKQVEFEIWGVVWYLILQVFVTCVASYVVMRWASAPFVNAVKTIRTAMATPDQLQPLSPWLSESAAFDNVVWGFALQVRTRKKTEENSVPMIRFGVNAFFLLKFYVTFITLSIITGYVMGIILSSVYERIVSMALQLIRKADVMNHYFVAQQEILNDAVTLMTSLSLLVYFVCGWYISRYMTTMIVVFARGLKEERFPIKLRQSDVYHELADTINAARKHMDS